MNAMNSKERVRLAFEHVEPDYVLLWYGAADGLTHRLMAACGVPDEEALMRRLHIDFRRVHARYAGPPLWRRAAGSASRPAMT